MLIAQNLTSQIKSSEFTVTMLPRRRLTGSVAGTGARSRLGMASARAQRFRDLRLSLPFVLLLQWALIDAPMPKLMRLLVTVIGAILGTFAFTDLIVLRLPFARRIF